MEEKELKKLRKRFYWYMIATSYMLPILYFIIKYGITRSATTIVVPTTVAILLLALRLSADVPEWVGTWEPSVKKGLVKGVPKIITFVFLVTFGLLLRYILKHTLDVGFVMYFETVFVIFGAQAAGAIFNAYHLMYKELYLIKKGYVLGVVNK